MKTKYIITYTSIFTTGYVQFAMVSKSKEVKINSIFEAKQFATKFRFKKIADLMCKFMQWTSNMNYDLRTYKVIEYEN
jgi:hypothetical protein